MIVVVVIVEVAAVMPLHLIVHHVDDGCAGAPG